MESPTKCFKILVDLVLRSGKLIELRKSIALGNDFNSSPRKREMEELPNKIVLHISITMTNGDNMPPAGAASTASQEVQESLDLGAYFLKIETNNTCFLMINRSLLTH